MKGTVGPLEAGVSYITSVVLLRSPCVLGLAVSGSNPCVLGLAVSGSNPCVLGLAVSGSNPCELGLAVSGSAEMA